MQRKEARCVADSTAYLIAQYIFRLSPQSWNHVSQCHRHEFTWLWVSVSDNKERQTDSTSKIKIPSALRDVMMWKSHKTARSAKIFIIGIPPSHTSHLRSRSIAYTLFCSPSVSQLNVCLLRVTCSATIFSYSSQQLVTIHHRYGLGLSLR